MINIYKLIDPNTNEIRYIGKTTKEPYERLIFHLSGIFRKRRFSELQNWLENLIKNHQIPIIEIIETVLNTEGAEKEKYYIQEYYKLGHPLINIQFLYKKDVFDFRSMIHSKLIYQYTLTGEFIKEWASITEAGSFYNLDIGNICAAANGSRKISGSFQWRYYKSNKINSYIQERHRKKVYKYSLEGDYIQEYEAVSMIEGIKTKLISKCCNGQLHTVYGFRYSFEKKEKLENLERKTRKDKGIKR